MTNPNNAIGTNGAYSGRNSVNAFNDNLALYTGRGILSGWATAPSSGLTVALGGDSSTRDVAIAEDNAGNKTTINNISGSPVSVTISAAPTTNSRIDLIVAYVDNPPQGSNDKVDNYEACGLIVVEGTVAASPSAPSEADIRSAITADGATGSTAYYVILSSITITSGTTDITSDMISAGDSAKIGSGNIDFTTYSTEEHEVGTWIDGSTIYAKTFAVATSSSSNSVTFSIPTGKTPVKTEGIFIRSGGMISRNLPSLYYESNTEEINPYFFASIYGGNSSTGMFSITYGNWFKTEGGTFYVTVYYR